MGHNTVTLSDGVVIEFSTRGNTGYKGVSFSPTYRVDSPFISFVDRNQVLQVAPRFASMLFGGHTFNVGTFTDAREAAYARSLFLADITGYEQTYNSRTDLKSNSDPVIESVNAPRDLYDLPAPDLTTLFAERAAHLAAKASTRGSSSVAKLAREARQDAAASRRKSKVNILLTKPADAFYKLYTGKDMRALTDRYGHQHVTSLWNTLKWDEFAEAFGLDPRPTLKTA